MNYTITFRNKKEINIDLTEDEVRTLNTGEVKMLEHQGNYYNMADVVSIEKTQEPTPQYKRIEAPRFTGGFDKLSTATRLKEIWDSIKQRGGFQHFSTYEDYCKSKENAK